jgi:hypothetical protein
MKAEISALLPLGIVSPSLQRAHVGGDMYLEKLDENWIEDVRRQSERVAARELLDLGPYEYRLCKEFSTQDDDLKRSNRVTNDDQEPFRRAITLSRIVKPTAVAYNNVWLKSFYLESGVVRHFSRVRINQHSVAYVSDMEIENRLTVEDAALMAELWNSLVYLLDNEPHYRRILRALKFYELAHAIYFVELSHPVFHAALESMICTSHLHNARQVIQRLPQLVTSVTQAQAKGIYTTCCDFKHAAQALQQIQTNSGRLAPRDQLRLDAARLLRQVVRTLLLEALRNRAFADELADPAVLGSTYQVFDHKGRPV